MLSNLKKRRNAAICAEVEKLCGQGLPVMDIYAKVAEKFWLEEDTIIKIYRKNGCYK
jgi:CO dehydrogenase/acetyl-CoA synthase alpha subunit